MNIRPIKTILMTEPLQRSETITTPPVTPQNQFCSQQKSSTSNLTSQHISWLWIELTKIYGQLFLTKAGNKDNGTWLETLRALTPKALQSGMERLKNLAGNGKFAEYPPNCLQFKALCMDFYNDLALPKVIDAYREVINSTFMTRNIWSHKVIECIAKRLPQDFFAIEHESVAYGLFKELYEEVCHLVKQGHELTFNGVQKRTKRAPNHLIAKTHLHHIKQQLGEHQ